MTTFFQKQKVTVYTLQAEEKETKGRCRGHWKIWGGYGEGMGNQFVLQAIYSYLKDIKISAWCTFFQKDVLT